MTRVLWNCGLSCTCRFRFRQRKYRTRKWEREEREQEKHTKRAGESVRVRVDKTYVLTNLDLCCKREHEHNNGIQITRASFRFASSFFLFFFFSSWFFFFLINTLDKKRKLPNICLRKWFRDDIERDIQKKKEIIIVVAVVAIILLFLLRLLLLLSMVSKRERHWETKTHIIVELFLSPRLFVGVAFHVPFYLLLLVFGICAVCFLLLFCCCCCISS